MVSIRNLVLLDILLHGTRFIVAEFAVGVFLPLGLGMASLLRGRAQWQTALGVYLLCVALNYLPLFIHALSFVWKRNRQSGMLNEIDAGDQNVAKTYTKQSLLLLVPLVVPVAAVMQLGRAHDD